MALAACFVLLQQQVAEPLFEAVDQMERRSVAQVRQQADLLLGPQMMPIALQQRQ